MVLDRGCHSFPRPGDEGHIMDMGRRVSGGGVRICGHSPGLYCSREAGTPVEELPPSDWSVGMSVRHFLD